MQISKVMPDSLRKQPSFFAPGRVAFRAKDICDLLREFHTGEVRVNFVILHKSAKIIIFSYR